MSDDHSFSLEQIEEFATRAYCAVDIPENDARTVGNLMAKADLMGADAHGIFRLPQYVARIRAGGINTRPNIRVQRENTGTALVDGDNALGHLVMKFAADIAIDKATSSGVSWVGTFNSNHAGPAGLYSRMALDNHMIGIYGAVANVNLLPPWGGTESLLSTNPISVAVPSAAGSPVVLDMATTVASVGKIRLAAQKGESIPEGWVIGKDGNYITDPTRFSEGYLAPIGGAKGYGLALMIGLLAGTVNGAAMGRDVVDMNGDLETATNTGQFICMVSLESFGDVTTIEQRIDDLAQDFRGSPTMPGFESVRLPGDESNRKQKDHLSVGITLSPSLIQDLAKLADELDIAPLES